MKLFKFFQLFFIFSISLYKLIQNRTMIDFSYYHKTADLERIMNELKSTCYPTLKETSADILFPEMNNKQKQLYSKLKYYDISLNSTVNNKLKNNKEKTNVFILAGEHPRELISSELILNFVKYLCMGSKEDKYLSMLNSFNFRIIINANPIGRENVESGEYCKRTNLNNVDINRNWDIHWKLVTADPEEFGGDAPFSEIETKFSRLAVNNFDPKLFLTIHSGTYGLFMPYAYLPEEGTFNKEKMKNILNQVKNNFCSVCDVGAPSKLLHYTSRGTCLDYIYDNFKIPYSFAWEIYSDEKVFPEMNNYEAMETKKATSSSGSSSSSFLGVGEEYAYELVGSYTVNNLRFKTTRAQTRTYSENENDYCIKLFNPLTKSNYEFIMINWMKAMLHLMEFVKDN